MFFNRARYISKKIGLLDNYVKKWFVNIKQKLNNLEETNIELAKQYLDDNRLDEAYTRLRIVHFLWPNNVEGTYFYALLLIFSEKKEKAIEILNKVKSVEHIGKLLHIAKDYNSDYILDIIKKNDTKLSDLKNVL